MFFLSVLSNKSLYNTRLNYQIFQLNPKKMCGFFLSYIILAAIRKKAETFPKMEKFFSFLHAMMSVNHNIKYP